VTYDEQIRLYAYLFHRQSALVFALIALMFISRGKTQMRARLKTVWPVFVLAAVPSPCTRRFMPKAGISRLSSCCCGAQGSLAFWRRAARFTSHRGHGGASDGGAGIPLRDHTFKSLAICDYWA
jgi:hypothetical protein